MTDLATGSGNPVATPEPAPPPQPAPVPSKAEMDARRASQIRDAVQKATDTVGKPAPGATQEPTKDAQGDVPKFFTKKAEAPEPAPFDPAKLTPELQGIYKAMQADFTKKWQDAADLRKQADADRTALAEERKAMIESQRALMDALKGKVTPPEGTDSDPMAQIQALRDEGRHAEADQLLISVAQKFAEAQNEPLKREAELNHLRTTFRDTASEVITSNPIVQRYKDGVVSIFDSNTPVMNLVRSRILGDAESVKLFVPLVMNAIATELHAKALEENYDRAVEAGIKKGLEAKREAAGRVPSRLVESGSVSKESPPGRMSLAESIRQAREKLAS